MGSQIVRVLCAHENGPDSEDDKCSFYENWIDRYNLLDSTSFFDYCNSLFLHIALKHITKFQCLYNYFARVETWPHFSNSTPLGLPIHPPDLFVGPVYLPHPLWPCSMFLQVTLPLSFNYRTWWSRLSDKLPRPSSRGVAGRWQH